MVEQEVLSLLEEEPTEGEACSSVTPKRAILGFGQHSFCVIYRSAFQLLPHKDLRTTCSDYLEARTYVTPPEYGKKLYEAPRRVQYVRFLWLAEGASATGALLQNLQCRLLWSTYF